MDLDWAKQNGVTLNFQQRRYAKNAEGQYLHFSGQCTTDKTHYAWHGSREQFENLIVQYPYAAAFKLQKRDQ